MSEFENQNNEISTPENGEEMSHSDKIVGIITEPVKTFEHMSKHPVRRIDWLLPIFLLLLILSLSSIVTMQNEQIREQAYAERQEEIEKELNKQVESGQMTVQEKERRMEEARELAEQFQGPTGWIIQTIAILFMGFVFFFVISGIYYLVATYILKGNGNYKSAMVANSMTSYIGIIQVVVATIISLAMNKLMPDVSVGTLLDIEKSSLGAMMLYKLDVFSIWGYAILGIGLAKLFKADDIKKYVITVFILWLGWSILMYLLGGVFPILKGLA